MHRSLKILSAFRRIHTRSDANLKFRNSQDFQFRDEIFGTERICKTQKQAVAIRSSYLQ